MKEERWGGGVKNLGDEIKFFSFLVILDYNLKIKIV